MGKILKKELYPIGTVVTLKGGNKKLLIYGRKVELEENDETNIYDYVSCLYPEGYLIHAKSYFFNHSSIEKMFHLGYINDEEKYLKIELLSNPILSNPKVNKHKTNKK